MTARDALIAMHARVDARGAMIGTDHLELISIVLAAFDHLPETESNAPSPWPDNLTERVETLSRRISALDHDVESLRREVDDLVETTDNDRADALTADDIQGLKDDVSDHDDRLRALEEGT